MRQTGLAIRRTISTSNATTCCGSRMRGCSVISARLTASRGIGVDALPSVIPERLRRNGSPGSAGVEPSGKRGAVSGEYPAGLYTVAASFENRRSSTTRAL